MNLAAKIIGGLAAIGLLTFLAIAQEPKKEEAKLIQGTWIVTELRNAGNEPTKEMQDFLKSGGYEISITGEKMVHSNDQSEMKYRLDHAKSPAVLELLDGTRVVAKAIFELKGDDLKICFGRKSQEGEPKAPVNFDIEKAAPGTFPTLYVLKRELAKPVSDPRTVVERYVAAALAGKTDDAVKLAVEGQSPSKKDKIDEFKALVNAKVLKFPTVFVGAAKGLAIAVTEEVKITKADPDGRDKGYLVFALVKSGDKWLVKDIDFDTEEKAKKQVEKFKTKHADAKELPVKEKG